MAKKIFDKYGISVEVEPILVEGKQAEFVRVVEPDGVVILPISDDSILIEKHYRHSMHGYVCELPAGHISKGEPPIEAAKRELAEETGYRPRQIRFMFRAREAQPRMPHYLNFFVASSLVKRRKIHDPREKISVSWVRRSRFEQMIKQGKITDLKTITAYAYYKMACSGRP